MAWQGEANNQTASSSLWSYKGSVFKGKVVVFFKWDCMKYSSIVSVSSTLCGGQHSSSLGKKHCHCLTFCDIVLLIVWSKLIL